DRVPRRNVMHQLPDRMRAANGMIRRILCTDAVEHAHQAGTMPGVAGERAVHLVDDSVNFAHYLAPSKLPGSAIRSDARRSEKFIGIEQDGDGAIVHEIDGHMRLENSGGHGDFQRFERAHELAITRLALFRRSGAQKTRAALSAGVAIQSELRNYQHGAADVEKRKIHFSRGVVEYSKLGDSSRHLHRRVR